jgi:hypothetical protein
MKSTSRILGAVLLALFVGMAAADDEPASIQTPRDLAEALLQSMGLEPGACPEVEGLIASADLEPLCGRARGGSKGVRKAVDAAIAGPELSGFDFIPVSKWESWNKTWTRASWWLSGASIEVLAGRKSDAVVILVSKLYPRCGDDVPFVPALVGGGDVDPPVFLSPYSYPVKAAKMKLDGAAALAVDVASDGSTTVRCIHHASPAGYGFELPAIEAAYALRDQLVLPEGEDTHRFNVVVKFSKLAERGKPQGVRYH